ncbi:aldose 1-epimerase family protein [Actinomyces slackii]|uniref:Putative aldose-1-epimerase n=2 Tax=Actinomyces slackii TaxID=52774 RepID=A0A3S4TAN0_9ACTO|nr:putative aldose-1-epimerase [Actinomyces slackii]
MPAAPASAIPDDEDGIMINGELIDLAAGDYQARIATCGATLVHLRRGGRDLVVPFDAEASLPGGWQGKTLVPWPNRVAGSRYTYGGVDYLLACNEPETGSALHGLVGWSDFQVIEQSASEVLVGLCQPGSYAYPWALQVQVRFTLGEAGLRVVTTTTSLGAALPAADVPGAPQEAGLPLPAPYGVSCHPYLTRPAPLEECTLTVPACRVLDVDPQTMAPAGERSVEGTEWDWRSGRLVGQTSTDNAYLGLPAEPWQVRLCDPEGRAVVMGADAPWVQIYTDDQLGRRGVAVEPMTCPPNAFNSGRDLITLEVGQSHDFTYTLHEE